jgi:hypothetical protein
VTTKREAIKQEIAELVKEGRELLTDEQRFWASLETDAKTRPKYRFGDRYHPWYSRALPLVRELQPDRAEEFELYFRDPRRKQMVLSTYTIQDHIAGLTIPLRHEQPSWARQAMMKFGSQISIVEAIKQRIDGLLGDIQGVVEAELLDNELDAAGELLGAKHLRAAGAVAGVALERHLKAVARDRGLKGTGKSATLAKVNDALKGDGVYGTPEWRRIQHLADIRNYCAHHKDRDPTKDEVDELIRGTDRVIKTIF